MRKLPQEFAFPLGLGSKKLQTSASAPNANGKNSFSINNNCSKDNRNSSLDDVSDVDADSRSAVNGGRYISHSVEDLSPRAPYQDLDTINL